LLFGHGFKHRKAPALFFLLYFQVVVLRLEFVMFDFLSLYLEQIYMRLISILLVFKKNPEGLMGFRRLKEQFFLDRFLKKNKNCC
jgi:hypothetical protein